MNTIDSLFRKILKYNQQADIKKIRQAYDFAKKIHKNEKRISGEPVIKHLLKIGHLLVDLKIDDISIMAGLMHRTLKSDKDMLNKIDEKFGTEVALIVNGLNNLSSSTKKFSIQKENIKNFRKLLIASTDDIRILIIRLTNKILDGRTASWLPKEKQARFAKRIFYLYGPLSEFIGLHIYKKELEDIAFNILFPDDYKWITKKLATSKKQGERDIKNIIKSIEQVLSEKKIKYIDIFGRSKGRWSTWNKIKKYIKSGKIIYKDATVILDRIGITILLKDVPSCYLVLGIIHSLWPYSKEKFNDYISQPKPNKYMAIHTNVQFEKKIIEIQIKTTKMHEHNEFGPASHIAYKIKGNKSVVDYSYKWAKDLILWKDKSKTQHFKLKVFQDCVYALTPKGDIIQLKKGSCSLDFAYKIHNGLGNACRGVKINKKMCKISQLIKNGDVVEIIKSREKNPRPSLDWIKIAQTKETKAKIKKALNHS